MASSTSSRPHPHAEPADRQARDGRALIRRARDAGVEILGAPTAWGAFTPLTIGAATPAGSVLIRPKQLIVATGAYERGLPVPGWTLPGVMTTGAAQTLLRTDGVVAGRRVLVCGNGPFNLQVALELSRAGAAIDAVVELSERPGAAQAGVLWRMLRHAPALLWQGMTMRGALARRGVRILHGDALAGVERQDGALRATLRSGAAFTRGHRADGLRLHAVERAAARARLPRTTSMRRAAIWPRSATRTAGPAWPACSASAIAAASAARARPWRKG